VYEGAATEMRSFKQSVTTVAESNECGITFKDHRDVCVGDVIECVRVVEQKQRVDDREARGLAQYMGSNEKFLSSSSWQMHYSNCSQN